MKDNPTFADEAAFADVAKLIGDLRLAVPLAELASEIKTELHNASVMPQPLAAEIRKNLEQLRSATRRFQNALNQVSSHLIELPPAVDFKPLKLAGDATPEILVMCDKALAVHRKSGKWREPGKLTCALIVIEAWAFVKGEPPGHNNEDAQEACEAYWLACTGQTSTTWQWPLKLARANKTGLRRVIRNKIRQGAE
jgi:hypothetical protein